MDDGRKPSPGKPRFAPKAPPRKKPHSIKPKIEVEEDEEAAAEAELLLRRFNENFGRQGSKVQKESSSAQVAFGQVPASSTPLRTFGVRKEETSSPSTDTPLRSSDRGKKVSTSPPLTAAEGALASYCDITDGFSRKKKGYTEPWDYEHTYYPTSLPLRAPSSGDPEILDDAEFGETARKAEYDENSINPASELGLLDVDEKRRMFFFQLPPTLPMAKRSASVKGKEIIDTSSTSLKADGASGACNLEGLPKGYMGKLLVYKSGQIKLKLGEALYDVSPGSDCIFPQNAVAVNASKGNFCVLGDIEKRVIVAPEIDDLLDRVIDLG